MISPGQSPRTMYRNLGGTTDVRSSGLPSRWSLNTSSNRSLVEVSCSSGTPVTPNTERLLSEPVLRKSQSSSPSSFVPLGGKFAEGPDRHVNSPTKLGFKVIDVPAPRSCIDTAGTPPATKQPDSWLEAGNGEQRCTWKPDGILTADDAVRAALDAVRQEALLRSKEVAKLKSMMASQHAWVEQKLSRCVVALDIGTSPSQTSSGPTQQPGESTALIRSDFDTLFRSLEGKMEAMRVKFVEHVGVMMQEQDRIATEFSSYVKKISVDIQVVATELRKESELRDMADAKLNSRLGAETASNMSRVDEVTNILQEAIAKDSEDMSSLYELVHEALDKSAAASREAQLVSRQLEKDRGRIFMLERQSQSLHAALQNAPNGPLLLSTSGQATRDN